MSVALSPQVAALRTSLSLEYVKAYKSDHPTVFEALSTLIPSTKKNVALAITDLIPEMREWLGDRIFHNPGMFSTLIENKHYELSMEVDADDVEDGDIDGYIPTAADLGDKAASHFDVLIAKVLQNAHTQTGFDGQYFFDNDHPTNARDGSGALNSNVETGRPLTAANWDYVVTQMASWKAGPGGGVEVGSVPDTIVVPRQLYSTAKKIFMPETVPNAAGTAVEQNIYKDAARIIVFDKLNNQPTTWYALDLRSRLKPFVRVMKRGPRFVMKNRPDDQGMFENNKIQFGIDGRWGVGLATWFKAFKASP